MKKKLKKGKKLSLNKKTLRSLEGGELKKVAGGDNTTACYTDGETGPWGLATGDLGDSRDTNCKVSHVQSALCRQ